MSRIFASLPPDLERGGRERSGGAPEWFDVWFFALSSMEHDGKTQYCVILHSTVSHMRGVNNSVHTKSEIKLRAYMRTYQRPPAPYQRGPGTSAVLVGTRGHDPSHLLPPCAFPGPHEPLRAAGHSRPRDGPDSHASEVAARPPCELRAVVSALPSFAILILSFTAASAGPPFLQTQSFTNRQPCARSGSIQI